MGKLALEEIFELIEKESGYVDIGMSPDEIVAYFEGNDEDGE